MAGRGDLDFLLLSELGHTCPDLSGFVAFEGVRSALRSEIGAGRGQGLCLYVREELAPFCSLIKATQCWVWVRVRLPGRRPLFVCAVYLPPRGSTYWSARASEATSVGSMLDAYSALQADAVLLKAQGEILMLGDFNARTGCEDDRAMQADSVLDGMGAPAPPQSAVCTIPPRTNADSRPADHSGRLLLELCTSSGCVLLNGRARGDEHSSATCRPYSLRGVQGDPSVIDYGVVTATLYPLVQSFRVVCNEQVEATSDHNPLVCTFELHTLPTGRFGPGVGGGGPGLVKWDASRREEYRDLISSPAFAERRSLIMRALEHGMLSAGEASELWGQVLLDAARQLFGSSGQGGALRGGRRAKWWFKHCKVEHAALQAALRTGDSHAAAAARNRFNARKRTVQRLAAQKAERDWLRDIKHNPRRFWTQYRGHRTAGSLHSMGDLASHWGSLFEAGEGGRLQDMFQSVSSCVSEVCGSSSASPDAVQAAAVLNEQLTLEEVEAALRKLKLGRMAGPDGLRGELLRQVYRVEPVELEDGRRVWRHAYDHSPGSIVHDLWLLFSKAFASGQLPTAWGACFVSAVFKKGDPAVLDNYRGIAVGSVIGKLFSLVLHHRMDSWAEAQGLRAKGQAGFRDGKCTNNHVFVLKHLIDRCRGNDRLYACFVDFRKAYDLVRRDLLLRCLADMGVRGNALSCLVSMYWSTPMVVKNGRDRGPSVDSSIGVKQGDPLSPLLFGLFIDRVEAWLREHAPECGVALQGQLLRVLLYADDLTLLASSPEELQSLLDALQAFCAANSLHVNVDKSAVVVFGRRKPRRGVEIPTRGWALDGQRLPVVPEFRYLGITFHQTSGVSACVPALSAAAMRAMWGLLARCKTLQMPSLEMRMSLFESLVSPILVYCSEVWGPSLLRSFATPKKCMDTDLHRPLFTFLRRLGGNLRRSTCRELLLREFGAKLPARAWLRASVQLWNRVSSLSADDPLSQAMRENVTMAHRPPQLWSVGFESFLRHIQALPEGGLHAGQGLVQLNVSEVLLAFDDWFTRGYAGLPGDPRQANSQQVSLCTYEHWFAVEDIGSHYVDGGWSELPDYVSHTAGIPSQHVRSLAAFRLGAHHYEVVTGRWTNTPRADRVCRLCSPGVGGGQPGRVGDEFHVVFECPGQEVPRYMHASLFESFGGWDDISPAALPTHAMRQFMGQNARLVASFIHACALRASEHPPDNVVFGDAVEAGADAVADDAMREQSSADEFFDCEDQLWEALDFSLDSLLEVDGFFPGPP